MTPSWPTDRLTTWSRATLAAAAALVPWRDRDDWHREWEGELWQLRRDGSGAVRLSGFLAGAWWHALWERKETWKMESFRQDVRHALRALRRSPGFALSAIVMLALAIGANTAIFSVLEASLLTPPPYARADRLVVVDTIFSIGGDQGQPSRWSYPRFQALAENVEAIELLAGYGARTMTLTELGPAEVVSVETATPSLFALLGVGAARGRAFGPDEVDAGVPVLRAVVSDRFWRTHLGGSDDAVGRTLTLDQLRFSVIGVLRPEFGGLGGPADVWIPFAALRAVENDGALDEGWNQHFNVVGRLADGVTLEQARDEVDAFGATILERFPPPPAAANLEASAGVVPFTEARVNPTARSSMLALFVAVVLVLLIATANLAGLLLARAATRQREAALRVSLGAGRLRVVRQFLTESLTLGALGGAAGIVVAWLALDVLGVWLVDALGATGGRGLEFIDPDGLELNARVLAFAALVTVGAGVAVGVWPAWRAARTDPNAALKDDQRAIGSSAGQIGRGGLIVLQVAVTLVLLAGASLMLRSLGNLGRVDPGYDDRNLLTAIYSLTPGSATTELQASTFHLEFLNRVRALPGVSGATLGEVPLGGPTVSTIVMGSEGRPELTPQMHTRIRVQAVPDGHFDMLGMRLVEGRGILASDDAGVDRVVVLGRTAAEELFPDGRAIGRRIQLPWPGYLEAGATVVGLVEDQQMLEPGQPRENQAWIALRQAPLRLATGLLVRTELDPADVAVLVRRTLADMDPGVALTSVMSMDERASGITARPRIIATLLGLFSAVSLFLVAAGLHGSIAFAVARRTRELGLRASLGATRGTLAMLVLRQGVGLTAAGLVIGVAGAFWATRYLQTLLFGTEGLDVTTVALVAALLLAVALVAAWMPARRAMRIDPMHALRTE